MEQKTLDEAMTPSLSWPLSCLWPGLSLPSAFECSFLTNIYTSVLLSNERIPLERKNSFFSFNRFTWSTFESSEHHDLSDSLYFSQIPPLKSNCKMCSLHVLIWHKVHKENTHQCDKWSIHPSILLPIVGWCWCGLYTVSESEFEVCMCRKVSHLGQLGDRGVTEECVDVKLEPWVMGTLLVDWFQWNRFHPTFRDDRTTFNHNVWFCFCFQPAYNYDEH